jgi:1-acyl-sn-glycerol-3-phosphate acyltransferase
VRRYTRRERLRQAVRLLAIAAWTVACYGVWLPGALVTLVGARAHRGWNARLLQAWSRGLVRALGVRVRVRGDRPRKPFFLVANHLGYLDILVLGSELGSTFVSKHELAGWPVLGHLARVTGTIFINRGLKRDAVRVLEEIDQAIQQGAGIVLFPEGTSSRGDRVYPLKPALLEWAAQRAFPVRAARLGYATDDPGRPADLAVCWWGDMTLGVHLMGLLALRRITATVHFDPRSVVEPDRGRLAARLRAVLEDGFEPVTLREAS